MFQNVIGKIRQALHETKRQKATRAKIDRENRETTHAKLNVIYDEVCAEIPLKKRLECPSMSDAEYDRYRLETNAYRLQVFYLTVQQVLERMDREGSNEHELNY